MSKPVNKQVLSMITMLRSNRQNVDETAFTNLCIQTSRKNNYGDYCMHTRCTECAFKTMGASTELVEFIRIYI